VAWMSTNRFSTVFDIQYNGVVGIQARSRDTTCVCVCVFCGSNRGSVRHGKTVV